MRRSRWCACMQGLPDVAEGRVGPRTKEDRAGRSECDEICRWTTKSTPIWKPSAQPIESDVRLHLSPNCHRRSACPARRSDLLGKASAEARFRKSCATRMALATTLPGKHPMANRRIQTMAQITLIEAVTQALAWEMKHDRQRRRPRRGCRRQWRRVPRHPGPARQVRRTERVIDTPLDETTIGGITVGLAAQGMKPVAEAQFEGFIYRHARADHLPRRAHATIARADA